MKLTMQRFFTVAALLLCLIIWLTFPSISWATHHRSGTLKGIAFSDSSKTAPMPGEWQKRPIRYEDWAEGADLAVTLDQHLYPILLPFVQKFAREHNVDIAVKEGTCGVSAGMLAEKTVDMAGFCCPAGDSDRLPGLKYHTVGIGPLAIIVHPDNPAEDLSVERIRALFMGEVLNWSEADSSTSTYKETVRPVARLHCKARPGHWRLILDNEDLFSPDLSEVGSIPDMLINVSSIRGGIGHVATWNIHKFGDQWKVKPLKADGISPFDREALKAGRYPFYRAYNITTWESKETKKGLARDLLEYLLEHAGEVDSRFGMVPASELKEAGWKFIGTELVGEPE